MKRGRLMIAAIAGALLLWPAIVRSWSYASGVQTLVTLFESHRHPDVPLDSFAAGRLGLIKPTWAQSYLYVAYRYIVGPGFDPAEQDRLVSMWDARLGLERMPATSPSRPLNEQMMFGVAGAMARSIDDAKSQWLAARNREPYVQAIAGLDVYRAAQTNLSGGKFVTGFYYANCNSSAFSTATSTLQTMINKFGISSLEVRRWVEAQDQVFDNCSNTRPRFVFNPQDWFAKVNEWFAVRTEVPGVPPPPPFTDSCKG